jgi:hypothetical protein
VTARRVGLALVAAALAVAAARSPLAAQEAQPSLSAGRVGGELIVGAYAGIGGFFIGRYVGDRMSDGFGVTSEVTRDRLRLSTGVLLAGAATAGSVYAIGNIGNQTGDIGQTAAGTAVGLVAAIALSRMVMAPEGRPQGGMSTARRWATANVIALLPAIGATVAFNNSRQFR